MNKKILIYALLLIGSMACAEVREKQTDISFHVPEEYLREADTIPQFWLSTVDEVNGFIRDRVRKGRYVQVGTSAGGYPVYAVFYGEPRQGNGSTTYSGSVSVNNTGAYRGPDHDKTVYMGIAGVHGSELEGIVGMVNLISVLETGTDLDGGQWPGITQMLDSLDRIILIPLVNPDGRSRLPLRMEKHRGHAADAHIVHEYLNTGGKKNGEIIGWPDVKEFIPMDFSMFGFPGGYPNDNGVNIMHDDFFGEVQPETRMLYDVCTVEKPDLIMNMHTGVARNNYFMRILTPYCEASLMPVWEGLYRAVHTELTLGGLQKTNDIGVEADPKLRKIHGGFNLNSALNYHCGGLCVTVENGSHGYTGVYDNGDPVEHTPNKILKSELVLHQEAMRFLHRTGGRAGWDQGFGSEQ